MSVVLTNNSVSKLASSLTTGSTTLSVTSGDGSKYPSPSGGNWFPLTLIKATGALEIVRCTSRSGDVFTVVRAQEGTAAQAFAAGDRVELRLTAQAFTETVAQQDASIAAIQAKVNALSASFRNKLINSKGVINQRAYVTGTATTAANQYTLDRWRVVTSGQNLGFSASGNGYVMTAPAGGVEQVIEGANIEGGVYTLSWSGTATATVNGVAITNGGQTTSLSAGADVTVKFIGGTFEKPQLEIGSSATAFEQRTVTDELLQCQRYFYRIPENFMIGPGNFFTNTVNARALHTNPVRMRVAPTVTYSAVTGVTVYVMGSALFSTAAAVIATYTDFIWLNASLAPSSATLGTACDLLVRAGNFIDVSSEL